MIFLILEQSLMALPLIMGAYITLSLFKLPDFSIESAYLFGAVAAYLAREHSLPVIIGASLLGGALVGCLVCTIHYFLKLPFLLAAIVNNGLLHGLSQFFLGTSNVSFHPKCAVSDISLFLLVSLAVVLVIAVISRSQLGYSFAIYGNNPLFFEHHVISGRFVMFSGVMLAHGCAGISGFLFAMSNGFVDLTMNFGLILLCLTALTLGKLCLRAPRPQILIPLLGVLGYFTIQQLLLRLGLDLKYFNSFQALFVLVVLFIGYQKQKITLNHLGV